MYTDTAPSLLISSLSLSTMSWLAEGKDIKEEAHLSSRVFAAFHGYHNSAQNISAHHHGGNCNVKPRTVKSQNTRHKFWRMSKRAEIPVRNINLYKFF